MLIQRFALGIALTVALAAPALASASDKAALDVTERHCDAAEKVNDRPAIIVYCLEAAEAAFVVASDTYYLNSATLEVAYKTFASQLLEIVAHFENELHIGTPREHLRQAYSTAMEVIKDRHADPQDVRTMRHNLSFIRDEMRLASIKTP